MPGIKPLVVAFVSAMTLGCASTPHAGGVAPNANTEAVAPQPVATSTNPDPWKIPPRPDNEMQRVKALEAMNKLFRDTYAQARAAQQKDNDLVILVRLSGATLFRNGVPVETARVIPAIYHNLRYAAHVPFALYLGLARDCDQPISQPRRDWAKNYTAAIDLARPEIGNLELTGKQRERQERLLSGARTLLETVQHDATLSCERLAEYARANSRDIQANIFEAGAAQVDGLHQQITAWRKQISDADWRRVRFIVHGPQQPRGGNAAVIYLSALVQDAGDARGYVGESGRVVFREDTSLPPNAQAPPPVAWEADLQLLAAIDLDAGASEAIFGDPDRLAVDIAAQGARAGVRELDLSAVRVTQ